jgi:arylsulfatase A-like enzyme
MAPKRREILKMFSGGALVSAATPRATPAEVQKPNIVIIMADQHRAGLTRGTGFPLDTMPALDSLASRGVSFDRAYTTAPLCVPARVSMLTGRWPHAHRLRQNSAARFAVYEQDLFQVCKQHGYRTALVGKNHTYLTPDRVDYWRPYSHLDGWKPDPAPRDYVEFDRWMQHLNHGVSDVPTPFPAEVQYPYRIASNAIDFMGAAGDEPFALWMSFAEPHNPYQVPKPYFDLFPPETVPPRAVGPESLSAMGFKWKWLEHLEESTYPGFQQKWRRTRSNYLGMLRLIDDQVARVLRHLDSTGKSRNTIVLYLADHGDYFCDYGLERKGAGIPEVLTRIPMVWSGWGIRPQKTPAFVSTADVLPTLCEAIGAAMPPGCQGRSLWPLLQDRDYPRQEFESIYAEVGFGGMHYGPDDDIDPQWGRVVGRAGALPTYDELNPVTQSGNIKMVRRGDWKLTFDMLGQGCLYDLSRDPYELTNLYGRREFSDMQASLTADLLQWTIRTQDDLPLAAYRPKWAERNWYSLYRAKSRQ